MKLQSRFTYQAAMVGALLALVAIAGMLVITLSGVKFQPTQEIIAAADFTAIYNDPANVDTIIAAFVFDSLFIVSYLVVFVGLAALGWERAPLLAVVGLVLGTLTGFLDAFENAHLITYAWTVKNVGPLAIGDLALPGIYLVTNLKWMAAFSTILAFGLAFPRQTMLEQVMMALMLIFVVVGVVGFGLPGLGIVRSLFFIVGMVIFAVLFWGYAKAAGP